jgi:pimeloyl-ACP methyl ester carboxylesterase
VYPAAFAAVDSPVLMLHGGYDPHPGRMIYESLAPFLKGLEYREWERCGHYPWREREVSGEFFAELKEWLMRHFSEGESHA